MATGLTLEADVLPVLGAFHAARGNGNITIHFEDGIPKTIRIEETLKFGEQARAWVRRLTRRASS